MRNFREFFEAVDIFGFENRSVPEGPAVQDDRPLKVFDLETMMSLLSIKKLGLNEATSNFVNEIVWGEATRPGTLKLEVDTGLTFFIKRMNYDAEGNRRWATKRVFQLNRNGMGGYEDYIAQEVFENIQKIDSIPLDSPDRNYERLENLSWQISKTMKKVAKPMFLFRGIKQVEENAYQIIFDMRAGGVETQDQKRVDQNVTQVVFEANAGVIRVTNYNIESPVGGDHNWKQMPSDFDAYFFPTQSKEEIAEAVGVHFKYY